MKEKRVLDKNLFGLLAGAACNNIIFIYMDTFLVAYLLNMSAGNFYNVALYYFLSYLSLFACYILFSFLIGKINKVRILQIAIILQSIFLFIMAILKDKMTDLLVLISIMYGVSTSLYYVSLNSLTNETVKGKKLQGYNTYKLIVQNITKIVIPIVFGSIIDNSSLFVIAAFVLIVSLLQIATTLLLTNSKIAHHKLNYKNYYNDCINSSNKRGFYLLLWGELVHGCRGGIVTLVTMFTVIGFKTNTNLGIISSFISILGIIILLLSNRKKNRDNSFMYVLISIITIFSMLLLVIDINRVGIILFNICNVALLSLFNKSYAIKRSGIIRAIDKKEYIIEHQAVCESFLNIGRIIFYLILMGASFINDIAIYQILLIVSTFIVGGYGVISYFLEKEYEKILIHKEFKKQLTDVVSSKNYGTNLRQHIN